MLKSNLKTIGRQIQQAIDDATREIGITGVAQLQANTPVSTGALRRSITFKQAKEGTKTTITFGSNISYAPYTEFRNSTSKFWFSKTLNSFSAQAQKILLKHLQKVGA